MFGKNNHSGGWVHRRRRQSSSPPGRAMNKYADYVRLLHGALDGYPAHNHAAAELESVFLARRTGEVQSRTTVSIVLSGVVFHARSSN